MEDLVMDLVLTAELNLLGKNAPSGVYVRESTANPLAWDAVLCAHEGPFAGAILKMRLLIPGDFPSAIVPRLFFQTPIFHPLVDPETGELSTAMLWRHWHPHRDRLWHIFAFARQAISFVDGENATHEAAAELLRKNPQEFGRRAQACARDSIGSAYNQSANCIRFVDSNHSSDILQAGKNVIAGQSYAKAISEQSTASFSHESFLPTAWNSIL